jgi:hypothetical protein
MSYCARLQHESAPSFCLFRADQDRLRDMQMLAFLGAKERCLDDYKVLVSTAQPRLQFVNAVTSVGSSMSVMEWIYV